MRTFINNSVLLSLLFAAPILYSQNLDWVNVNPYPQDDFYSIKFFNQNTGFVVGSGGVILKNTSGSNSWVRQQSTVKSDLYSIYFFDINNGFVCGANGVLLNTTNSGATWVRVPLATQNNLRCILFVSTLLGFIAGDTGTLLKTTDGGVTWNQLNVTSYGLNSVFFQDANTGFVCGNAGTLIRTTNGGMNWSIQTIGTEKLTSIGFSSTLGFITTSSQYSGSPVYKTTNNGLNWNSIQLGFGYGNYNSVKFNDQTNGFICGVNKPLMFTTDGGSNWNGYNVPLPASVNSISLADTSYFICGSGGFVGEVATYGVFKYLGGLKDNFSQISFLNANTGLISTGFQQYRTTNGGATWSITNFGWFSWQEGCAAYITWIGSFVSGNSFRVIIQYNCHGSYSFYDLDNSTNAGLTWTGNRNFYQTNIGIAGICEADGITFIIAAVPGIAIFKNDGSGWVQIGSGNGLGGLSFANQNTGIAMVNSNPRSLMRTTNSGANWTTTQNGFSRVVYDLKLLPSGVGYFCGDSSLFAKTSDYGQSWTNFTNNGGLRYMKMQWIDDNTGWIQGYNIFDYKYRLYYTPNGGTNIMQLQSLGNFETKGFSFIDAYTGYVCGDSGVVLKTTNGGITFVNPAIENLPKEFSLSQNFPNPFNPSTSISFSIPVAGNGRDRTVRLIIYDVTGREVATLVNSQMQPGNYSVDWDGSNYPSGVYFYRLSINNEQLASKKMVLIK